MCRRSRSIPAPPPTSFWTPDLPGYTSQGQGGTYQFPAAPGYKRGGPNQVQVVDWNGDDLPDI